MAVLSLGNPLGNPLVTQRAASTSAADGEVGDLAFVVSRPDSTWDYATGQKVFLDEYPDLFSAFGGVLPVTGLAGADTSMASVMTTQAVENIAVYGDNADTLLGLTVASYKLISNSLTTIYFVLTKDGLITPYSVDIPQTTNNYFTPFQIAFMPTGELVLQGYQSSYYNPSDRTGVAYLLKRNGSGIYSVNLSRVAITSGNEYNGSARSASINPSPIQYTGLCGPTSFYWYNGTNFQFDQHGSLYYSGSLSYSGTVQASSGNGLVTIQSFYYYQEGYNYLLFFKYRTSITSTSWSDATIYNESSVAYTAKTFFQPNYMWFNYDGSTLYARWGNTVKVFNKVAGQAIYNYSRSFSVSGSKVGHFVDDRYIAVVDGTTVRTYDCATGDQMLQVDVSAYFTSVYDVKYSNSKNYLIVHGLSSANSPFPNMRAVPFLAPLESRLQFQVPDLTSVPNTIASKYSPKDSRSIFMKVKP